MDRLVEDGLQAELPPPMSQEEQDLYEVKLHRRQVADQMAAQTAAALAPLALAAAVFAAEGPADLVLSIFPFHHLGNAADYAKAAFKTRKRNKRSRKLIKLQKEFEAELSEDARAFFQLAQKLGRAEQKALKTLAKHTNSPSVVSTLMTRHLRGEADLVWLAGKLKRKKIDKDFVRRFTFDGDFVKEFTEHEAHLSWRVLQDMVDNRLLDEGARAAMARKLHGLLAERAAAKMVSGPAMAGFFKNTTSAGVNLSRGVGYRTIRGREASIDIMAKRDGQTLFAEVKNLSADTWTKKGIGEVMAQLRRHNRGIEDIMHRSDERGTVVGKVLMVADRGLDVAMKEKDQDAFTKALEQIGWTLVKIPEQNIPRVETLIDSLR